MAARLPISWHRVKFAPFASVPGRCLWDPRWHLEPRARIGRGGTVKNMEFNDIMGDSMAQKLDLT